MSNVVEGGHLQKSLGNPVLDKQTPNSFKVLNETGLFEFYFFNLLKVNDRQIKVWKVLDEKKHRI